MSTISPVVVGVILAFGWNMTMSHPQGAAENPQGASEKESGVTLQVGLTVDQAAAQAWASATPRTATPRTATAGTVTGGSPRAREHTRPEGHRAVRQAAPGGCHRARPPRTPERAPRVRVVSACSST